MGRPATHTEEDLLKAASALFAAGGARAVTMNAVARAVGAPSGSIFHRFATRGSLLAAVWLRTVKAFHREYLGRLGGEQPSVADAVAATAWMVDWCRADLTAALILHAGVHTFEPDAWPAEARARWEALSAEQEGFITHVVKELARQTGLPKEEVAFVLFDLPLAAVRRHLLAQRQPGPATAELVRNLVTRLLAAQPEKDGMT